MGGSINRLVVRRRTEVERYVLTLLRGGEPEADGIATSGLTRARGIRRDSRPKPARTHITAFAALRTAALAGGLSVQPPESPYLGEDELRLLGWLAQAQRLEGLATSGPPQPSLLEALTICAQVLDSLGLRLSPLTLYGGRDSGDGRSTAGVEQLPEG